MQITSYAGENYKDIAHTLIDRWVDAPEYSVLKRRFSAGEQALGKLLLKHKRQTKLLETTQEQCVIICQTVIDIENQIDGLSRRIKANQKSTKFEQLKERLKATRRKSSNLKLKAARLQKKLLHLEKSIEDTEKSLNKIDADLEHTLRKKSRLEGLIQGAYQRPDIRRKAMMDALRITSHNMFQNIMKIFRPVYGNYRNDHVMLRMLTRTDGFMWIAATVVQIRLWLKGRYAEHQKKIFGTFVQTMTDIINGHFSGRAAKVEIKIIDTASQVVEFYKNQGVLLVSTNTLMT